MTNIFETTDPRGLEIICTVEQWNDHILATRSFMKGWEQKVKEAVENPNAILQDKQRSDRCVYYQLQQNKQVYVKVIVEFQDNLGTVITAFPADSMKSGEKVIWLRSKL